MPTSDLIRANGLKRNAQPLPGTTILAPIAAQADEAHIETTLARFTGSKVIEREQTRAVYHRVTKRDTLAKIAKRYGVSANELTKLNKIEAEIKPGQRLLIRGAQTRTVMTDERGKRTVVTAQADDIPIERKEVPKKKAANTAQK